MQHATITVLLGMRIASRTRQMTLCESSVQFYAVHSYPLTCPYAACVDNSRCYYAVVGTCRASLAQITGGNSMATLAKKDKSFWIGWDRIVSNQDLRPSRTVVVKRANNKPMRWLKSRFRIDRFPNYTMRHSTICVELNPLPLDQEFPSFRRNNAYFHV